MSSSVLLRGGTVYDGLGNPPRRADVLIVDDRVVAVGALERTDAPEVIECDGLAVTPGFIDAHAHSDLLPLLPGPASGFKVLQGVTTEVNGNCGISPAPLNAAAVAQYQEIFGELGGGVEVLPGTFADHLARVEAAAPLVNAAALVGHSSLRLAAAGMEEHLDDASRARMRALADEALRAGAIGLSTGLIYAPGCYGDTDEVIDLAGVAALHGAVYTTHMRDEGEGLLASIAETVAIARGAGIRAQVSHCKAMGERSHGRGPLLMRALADARREGVDILGDQYPYTAGATILVALLPNEALAGGADAVRARMRSADERARLRAVAERGGAAAGQWRQARPENVLVTAHSDPGIAGRRLDALAAAAGADPWDTLCVLVERDTAAGVVLDLMHEDDVVSIMRSPLVGIGSDNGPPVGLQHPRTWGCFPRLFGTYVRERAVLDMAEAVRKATSLTAGHLGLRGRGALVPGAFADVVVMDAGTIGHAGTYERPDVDPTGIVHVFVNGTGAVRDGRLTGRAAGRVLRRA